MLENIRNAITRLPMDRLGRNLRYHIPSRSRHVRHVAVAMAEHSASGDRTREPISMKFGTQQRVKTTMTVTLSNIKVFKILNGGRPP